MKTGCLIVGGLFVLISIGIVLLLVTSESDGRAPTVDFDNCSTDQQTHITHVYQAVFADREKFYDFEGLRRISGKRKLEMKRKLVKVWPLQITCAASSDDCRYGANTRGWIVSGNAHITLCAYTQPEENYCDTYAGIAFANAYTRNLRDSESAAFFGYARQLCLARLSDEATE